MNKKMDNCEQLDCEQLDCEQLDCEQLEIFVIFHDKLYPEMYEELTPEEFDCFKFVAVNGGYSIHYQNRTINEWELPIYDPNWQKNKWMNGGVNHHIVLNKLLTKKWACFVQYDMKFKKGSISKIKSLLRPNIGISMRIMNLRELLATSTYGFSDNNMYEHAILTINKPPRSTNYPLYHMCFLESSKWYELMPKVLEIDKELFKMMRPEDPWYRFPITTERTLALAIGCYVDDVLDVSAWITHERLAGQNNTL
jgi:hypothetical protein